MRLWVALLALLAFAQPAADVWQPVRFLIGEWHGVAKGKPGTGQSVRTYRFVLNDRFIEVKNRSTYPNEVHDDHGMISYDRARKRHVLRQFHVEGFVNQYVSEAGGGELRFVSESIENIPAGYRARETYTTEGADTFVERFELAAPGKDFELYTETRFKRAQSK